MKVAQTVTTDNEESEGLEFIDPDAEKRAQIAEAAKEREEKNQTIMINGQVMSSHAIPGQAKQVTKGQKSGKSRHSLLNDLKNKTLEKRSAKFDIDQLKHTFQTTDLNSKKKEEKFVNDPLAAELEKGIEEDSDDLLDEDGKPDADYKPEEEVEEDMEQAAVWDEEENIQSAKDEEESEEEEDKTEEKNEKSEEKSGKATPASVKSLAQKSDASSINAYDVLKQR